MASPAAEPVRAGSPSNDPSSTRSHERLLLAAVASGALLAPLNSTMLAVALPDIRSDFTISHAALGWLISSYLITMAVAQPIAGALGDQLGQTRVLRTALVVFLLASLAATIAPSFELLVALRIGQAAAGAALIPNGMALIRVRVPSERLGRVNGLFNAGLAVAAASGPLVGAALLEASSWRLLFLLNVPVVAVALVLHARLGSRDENAAGERPEAERRGDEAPRGRARIDWIGGGLFALILTGITWLLGSLDGGAGALELGAIAAATLLALGAFVQRQLSGRVQMVPWHLFRQRSFAAANAYAVLSNLVMYTSLLTIPFFIREVQNGSASRIGLLLGVMSFLMAALAALSGRLSDTFGRRLPALAGAAVALAGGVMLLAGIDGGVSFAYLAVALALVGSGIGLGTGAASTAAIEVAPRALAGAASGTNSMMRYVGSIVGAGVLAGLLGSGGAVPGVGVFQAVFAVVVGMALATVVAAAAIHVRVLESPEAPPSPGRR